MFNSVQEFSEKGIVRKLNLQESQFLPFLLIFLMPAGQPPAVQSVVSVDGLSTVRQVKVRSGLLQVGQVEGRHVGVGGGGAAVETDDSLVLLHPPVLLCEGGSGVAALTPRGGDRRTFIFLLSSRLWAVAVQDCLTLRLVGRLQGRLQRPLRFVESLSDARLHHLQVQTSLLRRS